jgi:hypothetical protein
VTILVGGHVRLVNAAEIIMLRKEYPLAVSRGSAAFNQLDRGSRISFAHSGEGAVWPLLFEDSFL